MKLFLAFILSLVSIVSFGQTTPLSFSQVQFSQPDFTYTPGRGAEQWNSANQVNIPVQGTNTARNDAYFRYQWYTIDTGTTAGPHYNWSIFDAQINAAITANQKFSFGIMSTCPFCGALSVGGSSLQYPVWLHNQMQGETPKDWVTHNGGTGGTGGGHVGGSGGTNMWVPNWNSPSYLAAVKQFCIDLNTHLNTTSHNGVLYANVINYIDIRLYGAFGEWHSAFIVDNINTGDYPAGTAATAASLDSIISYHASGFPNQKLVGMIAAFDGQYLLNTWNDPAVGVYLLRRTNNRGLIGWRRDNWGVYPDWNENGTGYINAYLELNTRGSGTLPHMKDSIMPRYLYAPIVGEPNNGSATFNSVDYGSLPAQVRQYHANSFGNGNWDVVGGANASGDSVRMASKTAGYRYTLVGGSMTTALFTGGAFNVTLNWQNVGFTPAYERWKVKYVLRNGSTDVATYNSSFSPTLFEPSGSSTAVSENFTATGVPAGTYGLYILVYDSLGYRQPMSLAITPRNPDGSYLIRNNIVVTNTGVPVAYAGPNQTIQLPTSSTTLDGTGSSGTITSYAWTQVSGPNTASIATPTTVTTSVTGMIAGTYTFQLSVNGGVSSSQVLVTVTPAVVNAAHVFTSQTPGGALQDDVTPITVGMKFQSAINGYITGVRFYKQSGNTGTHIGYLFNIAGTQLATATFSGETATGWQDVTFSAPVLITANTVYVCAYFSPNGTYSEDDNFFGSALVNAPLTGLADGTSGPNGVFRSNATPGFPTSSFQQTNYWVDVDFVANVSFVVGTGSGQVTVTQTGHLPGDTALIATQTGIYTSLILRDLNGLTVRPQTGRPTFTTQSTWCRIIHMDVGIFNFVSAGNATAIDCNCGRIDSSVFHNLYFEGWSGTVWNAGTDYAYTYGNDTTYKWLRNRYDSIKFYHCGKPYQVAFGVSPINANIARRDTFRYNVIEATTATSSEGIMFSGVCYGCLGEYNTYTATTGRGPSGDNGMYNGAGWWIIRNNYQSGSPARFTRIFPMMELNDTGTTQCYNNVRVNCQAYGMFNIQAQLQDSIAGQRRCNGAQFWNNTLGNQFNDTLNLGSYWSPEFDLGQVGPGMHYYVLNNFAFNVGNNPQKVQFGGQPNNGKPQMAVNLGGWTTIGQDTAHNTYSNYATQAALDSVSVGFTNSLGNFSYYKFSPSTPTTILHSGVTNPLTSTDFLGQSYRVPPDPGYIQFSGTVLPPTFIPGLGKGKKRFVGGH